MAPNPEPCASRPRLLLVDDEEAIRTGLEPFLARSGYAVVTAADGMAALRVLDTTRIDIVVSDVLMPGVDGRELVRRMRAARNWTPVILLTQIGESHERSAALNEGADDYLSKPFDPAELLARVRAVLRRSEPGRPPLSAADRLRCGPLILDRAARRTWLDGREVTLTPKASMLLDYLMTHPGEAHTREHLLTALWGFDFAVTTRAVDHRVAEIRRVLADDAAAPRFVETVAGVGYRFRGEVDRGGVG